jgi:hypothetical protein
MSLKKGERQMRIVKISCVVFLTLSFVLSLSDTDNWALEPWWFPSSASYSCTVVKRPTLTFRRRLLQWTALLIVPIILPLLCWLLRRLEPLIISANWNVQAPLEAWQDPLVKKYEDIFNVFDFSGLPGPKRGPKRNTLDVYAKVFLIKVNHKRHYSSDLRTFFFDHPQLIPLVGF